MGEGEGYGVGVHNENHLRQEGGKSLGEVKNMRERVTKHASAKTLQCPTSFSTEYSVR